MKGGGGRGEDGGRRREGRSDVRGGGGNNERREEERRGQGAGSPHLELIERVLVYSLVGDLEDKRLLKHKQDESNASQVIQEI